MQLRFLLLVILACLLSACTSTQVRHAEGIVAKSAVAKGKRLLLMPPEVEITEMLASGIQEPRPEWTQAAKQYIAQSLAEILKQSQTELIAYAAPADEAFRDRTRQLELLHQAVGGSIAAFGFRNLLPSKHDRFDWTLGPGVVVLKERFKADYALYTYVYDSYASAGRKAMRVVGLLASFAGVGVSVQTGYRIGFASLIDLRDGRVIWSGLMVSEVGDLRNAKDAMDVTRQMLKGAPF